MICSYYLSPKFIMWKISGHFTQLWRRLEGEPNEDNFYESIVLVLRVLRLLGLYPIKRSSSEKPHFELDKPYLVLALLVYGTMAIASGVMFVDIYTYAYLLTGDFLIKLETYVACSIMMTTLELPYTFILEALQFRGIFCSWYNFQKHFKQATGTFIDLKIVKLYTILHVFFFLLILSQLLLEVPFYIPNFFLFRLAYAYPYVQLMLAYIVPHISLKAAAIASYEYNVHFQKMMDRASPRELEHYRLLWVELSNLMQESSDLYHHTNSLNNWVAIMVGLILHVYRLILVFPKRAMNLEIQKFAVEVFLILYRHLYFLLILYDHGETITRQCSEPIHKRINLYRPLPFNNRKRSNFTERVFFYSLLLYKPVLSVHGYFKLDRSTFTSMMATVFTYLVVLIQMKRQIGPEQLMKDTNESKFVVLLHG